MKPIRILLVLLVLAIAAQAQTITQSIPLQAGWNSIWLKVQPPNASVAAVFAGLPVVSVWTYIQQPAPVQFIQNQTETQFTQPGWLNWAPPPSPVFLNSLLNINGGRAYLVKASSAANLLVTGELVNRPVPWLADSFNLRGFPVSLALVPTFGGYFAGTAHAGQRIYKLATNGIWQLAAATDSISASESYWVYSSGGSTFQGTFSVASTISGTLDFSNALTELTPRLTNNSVNPITVTITDSTANSPLSYQAVGGGNIVWTNLPAGYQVTIAPGGSLDLRLAIRRKDIAGDTYTSTLELKDNAGTRIQLALKAAKLPAGRASITAPQPTTGGNLAGLWVGTASINQVNEVNSSAPANVTATRSPFDLKLLLHVTAAGEPRLLKEVIQMWQPSTFTAGAAAGTQVLDKPGRLVLLTKDSLLSSFQGEVLHGGIPVGRRTSTVDYDFDGGVNNYLTMTGTFATGSSIGCAIDIAPNAATNPFKHKYHPDHDNLSATFQPLPTGAEEAFHVTRQLQLTLSATDPESSPGSSTSLQYGTSVMGGTYTETITGLHKRNIVVRGTFRIVRVSNQPVLNQ